MSSKWVKKVAAKLVCFVHCTVDGMMLTDRLAFLLHITMVVDIFLFH